MRAFFSIIPDPQTALAIESWRQLCWPQLTTAVPAGNLHVTLAFLGEIDDVVLQSLHNQADEIPKVPFELSLNRLGYWSKPGILWLGTDKVPTALDDLAAKLVGAASLLGIRKEHRDFKPHVTLKRRLRDAPMGPLVDPDFTLQVTEFHLMESRLHKSGVQYQSRLSWSL